METGLAVSEASREFTGVVCSMAQEALDILPEKVGLGTPGTQENLELVIFLYDIRRNWAMQSALMQREDVELLRCPSVYYELYYMLVPCPKGDEKYRMTEEIRMLDVLLQGLTDRSYLYEDLKEIELELLEPDIEDKIKIWNGINQPFRTALYVRLSPVEIFSGRTKRIKRVTDMQMKYDEDGEK